jgi:hypothetical protein
MGQNMVLCPLSASGTGCGTDQPLAEGCTLAEGCRGDIYGVQQPAQLLASAPILRYTDLDPHLATLERLRIATHTDKQPRCTGCRRFCARTCGVHPDNEAHPPV